ncbi:DUF732 domain-containing protein [Paenarthrobacter sp. YJN-5]|uniref:DUF732 domain-containing protein n=1 Tax=Paenarthrobacter sp. YJN-5 TaxID=2735316 RepID=UPI001878B8E6|nr:DUF732 domain-containing protein [Paenarthrobacter sp. YJN-5]QOT15886.1 DUF732 domain-containing protein [Paenarthrobacter sp. YJN-5]
MRKLVGVVTVLLLVAGCSAGTGEAGFVDRVKGSVRTPDGGDYGSLVQVGRDVCASKDTAAATAQQWADAGFREDEAKSIVTAAVETLCPDRKPWLDGH